MSSQLNVDTIVDKAGSGGSNVKMANTSTYVSDGGAVTQNTVQGLAKAWLFGSSSAVLQDSFNISTPTDHGTGDYSYTLTNPFSNDDYSLTATANSTDERRNATENGARSLAGTLAVETSDAGSMDNTAHNITAHGDLS